MCYVPDYAWSSDAGHPPAPPSAAYLEGENACWAGDRRDDNPYEIGTVEHTDWRDGHSDAGDVRCGMERDIEDAHIDD